MSHRRTPSALQASNMPHEEQQRSVLSASGVGVVVGAVVAAAATAIAPVASSLPAMRSSISLDSDDDDASMSSLMSSPPGTPSKFVPHPPRFLPASSSGSGSGSRSARETVQRSLQRFVSRALATLSPRTPGLPLKSPHLTPSPSHAFNLSSLPTRAHIPVRRRATFFALVALIVLCTWTLFTTSLAEREATAYSEGMLRGWKDRSGRAQRVEAEEHRRLLSSASFRAAVLSASPDTGRRPHPASPNSDSPSSVNVNILTLTPADELAALIAFMAALPWNALPPHVDPSRPLDPTIILDFDPSHPRARDELASLRWETWQLNPVVLFGKARHAGTRDVRRELEKLNVDVDEIMRFEMEERVDGVIVMGILGRLVSSLDPSSSSKGSPEIESKSTQLDLPLLLVGGRPIRGADVSALAESGELARLLRDAGARMAVKGKKKKGGN